MMFFRDFLTVYKLDKVSFGPRHQSELWPATISDNTLKDNVRNSSQKIKSGTSESIFKASYVLM